jgi:hypothetical protein
MNTGDRWNEVGFVPVLVPGHVNDHDLDAEGPSIRSTMGWDRFLA